MTSYTYTIEQHVQMIKLYYQNGCSLVQTRRALRPIYGRRSGPSQSTIQRLVAKFEATGSVTKQQTFERRRNARSAENIAAVRESVRQNPNQSIPSRAQELGLSQTSIWRILHRDLGAGTREKETSPNKSRKCKICQKSFYSNTYLREHMLRHFGKGPKKCSKCYRKFIDKNKYEAHLETHKLEEWIRSQPDVTVSMMKPTEL